MFQKIKEFFFGKPVPAAPEAPYKVEAPVATPAKCGCGRSQSGLCVGLHKLTPEEWAVHADNPAKVEPAKVAPADKPNVIAKAAVQAKKKAAPKKPAAIKAPAKPKAPRKPKAK